MQTAAGFEDFGAGANEQMVGVAENDLRLEFLQFGRADRLDGAARADRHKHRRLDLAMRQRQLTAASAAVGIGSEEGEHERREGTLRIGKVQWPIGSRRSYPGICQQRSMIWPSEGKALGFTSFLQIRYSCLTSWAAVCATVLDLLEFYYLPIMKDSWTWSRGIGRAVTLTALSLLLSLTPMLPLRNAEAQDTKPAVTPMPVVEKPAPAPAAKPEVAPKPDPTPAPKPEVQPVPPVTKVNPEPAATAAAPAPAAKVDPAPDPVAAPTTERSIYIPYEDLEAVFEEDGRGVFLPYREFLDLWNQLTLEKEKETIDPPTDGVLAAATYQATLEGDDKAQVLKIEATLQAESFKEKGWAVVPLISGELNVADADTGDATLQLTEKGYQLILPHKGSYEIKLTLYAKVTRNAGRHAVNLNLPKAGVSRFEAALPEQGWEFDIQPGAAYSSEKLPDGGTRLAFFFGATERFNVTWQKQGEETTLTPLLFVEADQSAKVIPGALQSEVRFNYRILRAGVDRFAITVPSGQEVLGVTGENIREWDVQKDGTAQLLTVQLHAPAKQNYRLVLSLEEALDALPTEFNVPEVQARDVVRQRGTVRLSTSPELEVAVVSNEGLTQQALSGWNTNTSGIATISGQVQANANSTINDSFSAGNGGGVIINVDGTIDASGSAGNGGYVMINGAGLTPFGSYRYLSTPFAMSLSVKKAEPEVEVQSFTRFKVEPDEATFTTRFNYAVKRVGIFDTRIVIPDGYENVEASGDIIDDDSEEQVDGKRVLTVKFKQRQSGEFSFILSGRRVRAKATDDETVPVFSPLDVERHEGRLGVEVHTSLDPTTKEVGDLRQQDVSQLKVESPGGPVDPFAGGAEQATLVPVSLETIPGFDPLTLGFRYRGDAASAVIAFTMKESQIKAEVLALIEVRETLVRYEWRIDYDILYAGVDRLVFSVPEAIAEALRVDGEIIKEKDRDYKSGGDGDDKIDAGEGRRLWSVVLRDKRMGAYELRVTYEMPLADASERDFTVVVPELRLEQVFQENGQLAVIKDDNLEVLDADVINLEQIDPSELHGWLSREGIVRAYKYRRHPVGLSLNLSRNEFLPVPQAVVTYAVANTVVAADRGMTSEVIYWVKNNAKQFLSVELPENGSMVSDIFVNGEAQQPMRRADENEVLIRLPVGVDKDAPISVRFVYETPSPEPGEDLGMSGKIRIAPASVTQAEVLQSLTRLYLPDDYLYRKFDSAMRLPVSYRGWSKFRSAFDWLIPALGPQIDAGRQQAWSDPPELGAAAGAGGFDITIPREGQSYFLHRLDAADQITVSYRSRGFAFFWEALFCLLAFAVGIWLLGKALSLRFAYFVGVGLLSLIIAGAVAPGSASFWRAIYLGVFLAALIWLAVGLFASLRALRDGIVAKAKARKEIRAEEKAKADANAATTAETKHEENENDSAGEN